jgi:hypothetical protein
MLPGLSVTQKDQSRIPKWWCTAIMVVGPAWRKPCASLAISHNRHASSSSCPTTTLSLFPGHSSIPCTIPVRNTSPRSNSLSRCGVYRLHLAHISVPSWVDLWVALLYAARTLISSRCAMPSTPTYAPLFGPIHFPNGHLIGDVSLFCTDART